MCIVVDGIPYNAGVNVKEGEWYISADEAEEIFGVRYAFGEEYVNLREYAETENIGYVQDEVLTAAYFSTWETYGESGSENRSLDFERAFDLGLASGELSSRREDEIRSSEYRALLAGLVEKTGPSGGGSSASSSSESLPDHPAGEDGGLS